MKSRERELKKQLNISAKKTNTVVQNRTRKISEMLTVKGRGTECVRNIKYWWTVISNTNDGTEVKARILAANKAYSSLQTVFRSKQIN